MAGKGGTGDPSRPQAICLSFQLPDPRAHPPSPSCPPNPHTQTYRKSRKRYKKRKFVAEELEPWGLESELWPEGVMSSQHSLLALEAGLPTDQGSDGVRATYALFPQRVPGLTPATAPTLFAYLEDE